MTGKGANQNTIQEMNRSLVLNVLRKQGVCSRAKIAKMVGLRQATVTYIINDLLEWKLVCETGLMPGGKGRRSIGVSINNDVYRVIGIRLSRKSYSVGLFNLSGEILSSQKTANGVNSPDKVLENIKQSIKKMLDENGSKHVLALGIALPGPFIKDKNRIALMTDVPGWEKIDIKTELQDGFSLPVFTEHDANAGVFAHFWDSEPNSAKDVLTYIAFGRGIGSGIIQGGELFRGYHGTAGEIGHTSICFDGERCECGNYGCLESYTSSTAFSRTYSKRLGREVDFKEAAEAVKNGEEIAIEEYKRACEMLGVGIANLINTVNPNRIIIGDDMAHIDPVIVLDVIWRTVTERTMAELHEQLMIEISKISKGSILAGAGIIAINEVLENPALYAEGKN